MIKRKLVAITVLVCLVHGAIAQHDSLDTYIKELKTDYAGPRTKTGFMSFGGDFLNAQEYFDVKNYEAAARSFFYLVEKDSTSPYANYQFAIALLKQHDEYKAKQAKGYLIRAFKLEPSLVKRFEKEMPAVTITATDNIASNDTAENKSNTNGLKAYVDRLKYSNATRGAETAMNTPGQQAISAIEYYEAHEYLSAENNFKLALLSDETNPYLRYMLAVSLAAQGKTREANTYFEKSAIADAALKTSYDNDVATATTAWIKLEDSRKVKTTPAATVAHGGALVFGNYMCSQSVYRGANATPAYGYVEKGYFALKADGTYRWLDDGPIGRYSYNAKTGTVTWLSGYLKNNGIKSTLYQRNGRSGQMTLTYSDSYTWQCGCNK